MSRVSERIAYLKGLKDGMNLSDENLAKLLTGIIETLDAVSDRLDDTDEFIDEIAEVVDDLGDDVDDINDFLDEIEEEEDDDDECCCCCDDDECDCCEDGCIEVECPYCHEQICYDADVFVSGDALYCPVCERKVFDEE